MNSGDWILANLREVGRFARFTAPVEVLDEEWRAIEEMTTLFPPSEYEHLVLLLKFRTRDGHSLLTAAARYHFRREIISDEATFRESIFAGLTRIQDAQDQNFKAFQNLLTQHRERLAEMLGDIARDIKELREQVAQIAADFRRLLQERELDRRPVSFRDSMSVRNDGEREFIHRLVQRYRDLPRKERLRTDLQIAVGKAGIISGDYEAAQRDFQEIARASTEPEIRAEAFFNAYHAALEQRDWANALQYLQESCKVDQGRYAPFPLDQYPPERILGAGGFGVAFLCQDVNLQRPVVVKSLFIENRNSNDDVLAEARLLAEFEHPGVVKLRHCGFVDQAARSRPYLVMDYFESTTLEDHVRKNGPLPPNDVLAIALQTAEALRAAHERHILHRDVKPANLLVRQEPSGWQVKLIDFGLALRQELSTAASAGSGRSIASAGIAGTLEYAAPEQIGRLRDVQPGPPADIYSFAKTCCHALFGTTQPLRKHWTQIPRHLSDLLEDALSENPHERPPDFDTVIRRVKPEVIGPDPGRERILDHYQKRLSSGISRSPLLKAVPTKTGRLLDVNRLMALDPAFPARVLTAIMGGNKPLTLDLRSPHAMSSVSESGIEPIIADGLYDLLDRKMRRQAETAKKETGVHALWLGYPLLYASAGNGEAARWALAPLFLWPVTIEVDTKREKHLYLARAADPSTPRFNRVLSLWVRRELEFNLSSIVDDDLDGLDWPGWREVLRKLSDRFANAAAFDFSVPLESIPDVKVLQAQSSFRVIHGAVLGYFRWQNEAILADLEAIREKQDLRGVVNGFVSTVRPAQPPEVKAPPEEDRFLVSDSDFSQEKVVWQARSGPGLVVHGPPGTGKSQTIVNVIADTLARGRTVMMVCQKQAATRVVLERLRAVGLGDLCLEIHDAEQDRKEVFRTIKSQVERLGDVLPGVEHERGQLAREITALERELDEHARAFHQRHPRFGLSYRELMATEREQHLAFPSVRPLASLQRVLEGLSWTTVEAIVQRVRNVGRWFAEGDALHNPWRDGKLGSIQPSLALRADIRHTLMELRSRDADHVAHVGRHGLGMTLPQDLLNFPAIGSDVLKRLRALISEPHSLTLRWLPILRQISEEKRQQNRTHLQQIVETAERLKTLPPDARWEELAGKAADFAAISEHLTTQLDRILEDQRSGRPNLKERWLRAVRGASQEATAGHRRRMQAVEELARQITTIPENPGWIAVQDRVPELPKLAEPILERLEQLAGEQQATLSTITQSWLEVIRGPGREKVPKFESDCRQAVRLAQLTASTLGDASEPSQRTDPDFVATGSPFLERLARLRATPPSDLAQMARCYLRALRREDDVELQKRATACRQAIELVRHTAAAVLDPVWEKICDSWSLAEVEASSVHAVEFLRRCGSFSRLFSGAFRRAKQELLRLRPAQTEKACPLSRQA